MGAFSGLGFDLSPMFGAAAMSVSSFIVVMNALRINFFGKKYKKNTSAEENKEENETTNEINEKNDEKEIKEMTVTLKIEGMMCPHCEARVKSVLEAIPGVREAVVSHKEDRAEVHGEALDRDALAKAVCDAGYTVVG
jgi:copper chaperone CopZ